MLVDHHAGTLPQRSSISGRRQALLVAAFGSALLGVFYWWGRPGFYFRNGWDDILGPFLGSSIGDRLGGYVFWALSSLTGRVVLPLLVIAYVLRRRPADFGYRAPDSSTHWLPYVILFAFMAPILVFVSTLDSFTSYYPMWSGLVAGGLAFWVYELAYAVQFLGVEAFFRGFLLFGLRDGVGDRWAIVLMTIPYVAIHAGKPGLEIVGAAFAGLALGHLALKSGSFVPGVFLHIAVAVSMDLLVLNGTVGLGGFFW